MDYAVYQAPQVYPQNNEPNPPLPSQPMYHCISGIPLPEAEGTGGWVGLDSVTALSEQREQRISSFHRFQPISVVSVPTRTVAVIINFFFDFPLF